MLSSSSRSRCRCHHRGAAVVVVIEEPLLSSSSRSRREAAVVVVIEELPPPPSSSSKSRHFRSDDGVSSLWGVLVAARNKATTSYGGDFSRRQLHLTAAMATVFFFHVLPTPVKESYARSTVLSLCLISF
ncbi:hypothetical protein ACLB2K_025666 [Fragaria x ananassa]